MALRERRPFPLVPRRHLNGLPFGDVATRRPGHGSEVIGLRPYQPGDSVGAIDWFASARLSAATGGDDFVVRRHAADESPRVVLLVDRRPAMGLYPEPLPWLSKPAALRESVAAVVTSAVAARADVGSLDFEEGELSWIAPGRGERPRQIVDHHDGERFDAADDNLQRGLTFLAGRRIELPPGSFVFVLSDFLVTPAPEVWQAAVTRGLEVVPVIIRDPVWESSFPVVQGVSLPVADPRTGRVRLVRLGRRAAVARREQHERRHRALVAGFESFGLRPISLVTSDPAAVDAAFAEWAEERRRRRWVR